MSRVCARRCSGTDPGCAQGRPMLRPGALRARQGRLRGRDRAHPLEHRGAGRPGPAGLQPRRAASSARPSPPSSPSPRVQRSGRCAAASRRSPSTCVVAPQAVAGGRLAQVREVRLDGEVAAHALEVGGVDPDQAQQRVGRVAEHLQVAALVRVPVVVHPLRRHRRRVQAQRPGEVGRRRRRPRPAASCSSALVALEHRAGAVVLRRAGPGSPRPGSRRAAARARGSSWPPAWASDCATSFSTNASVSSGTSVSFVHGHSSAGPNCSMKWRMPASPPAVR